MKSVRLPGLLQYLLWVAGGLFLTGTAMANQVYYTEQSIQWSDGIVRVAYTHQSESVGGKVVRYQSSTATANPQIVFVVDKLGTFQVRSPVEHKPRHRVGNYFPEFYRSRVWVRVPVRYYLSSWDVKALERELERLGVKVKPKPAPPKPVSIISG